MRSSRKSVKPLIRPILRDFVLAKKRVKWNFKNKSLRKIGLGDECEEVTNSVRCSMGRKTAIVATAGAHNEMVFDPTNGTTGGRRETSAAFGFEGGPWFAARAYHPAPRTHTSTSLPEEGHIGAHGRECEMGAGGGARHGMLTLDSETESFCSRRRNRYIPPLAPGSRKCPIELRIPYAHRRSKVDASALGPPNANSADPYPPAGEIPILSKRTHSSPSRQAHEYRGSLSARFPLSESIQPM
ncbi:hypothetical protein K438DRAFT_1762230 [Mycena galopus ATCC 62051]|nr:hypothetical protein K438DRAFT_1762230 [Mycena galopus ATCC 62051]